MGKVRERGMNMVRAFIVLRTEGFYRFSQKAFAAGWADRFPQSRCVGLCK